MASLEAFLERRRYFRLTIFVFGPLVVGDANVLEGDVAEVEELADDVAESTDWEVVELVLDHGVG